MRTDRIFARLEQEPARPLTPPPGMSGTRRALFLTTLGLYAAIVAAVLTTSRLVRLDWRVMLFRPYKQWPELHAFLDYFVVLGQRGPTAVLVAAWLGWRSWRQRTLRPLLVLGTSLLLLNVTVGAAKLGMGREGPHYANRIGANEMFLTGDIFPSGHTANAVVTWGILAYLATTPRARRRLSVVAAVFALGVGTTTVYIGTHWVSDVLLGWASGLLILLALPWFEPLIARAEAYLLGHWYRFREGLAPLSARLRPAGTRAPAITTRIGAGGAYPASGPEPALSEPVLSDAALCEAALSAESPADLPPRAGEPRTHHPVHARQHAARSERSPVTPAGSRRPYGERTVSRTAPMGPRK
ncbi:phosphatase PAP2 family protein [Streptomyces chitinivorans]|uniref:Phosphatase PAP2 family protein n=1 Tax=Streptomyces chitinivorans TaxID=1257027 RepID=A0ABW7HTG0_9ACTN|nr:phosphatase PAP2 family protein [Streptomyces chitinivorans]MDH2411027.1 phosphatase PAP2 family protein [Streptomyces chitinivorans]